MTVSQLAKELNVSRQTVYNAIKSNGLSMDNLTTVTQGDKRELTAEGVKTIRQLVKNKPSVSNVNLTQLQREVDKLTAELATVKADNDRLTAELDKLKEDNSILIKTIATQAVTIQQTKDTPKRGLLAGIRQRLTAGNDKGSVK